MKISLEKQIAVGLVAVLILLFGIGFLSYRSTTDLITREARVAQTHQVRETIEHLLYLMEDVEDKQRLALLAGENQCLQFSREAGHRIDEVLHNLTDLIQESQIQQAHLLAVRRLID